MSRILQRTAAILNGEQGAAVLYPDQIRTDGGTQMRAGLNEETIGEYVEAIIAYGWPFPPVVVYHDGEAYWLGDGFHRVEAARRYFQRENVRSGIPAEVRSGTRRDAVLCAAGANADHGLRRTNADKWRSVEVLLNDEEWSQWSNREIARRCKVSESLVRTVREKLGDSDGGPLGAQYAPPPLQADTAFKTQNERTFIHHKTGQPTTMNINGQRQAAEERKDDTGEYWLLRRGWRIASGPDNFFCVSKWIDGKLEMIQRATKTETVVAAVAREQQLAKAAKAAQLNSTQPAPAVVEASTVHPEPIVPPREMTLAEVETLVATKPANDRNDRLSRLLELYRQVATSASEYGQLTGDFPGTLPLRRAIEPMIAKLLANLPHVETVTT